MILETLLFNKYTYSTNNVITYANNGVNAMRQSHNSYQLPNTSATTFDILATYTFGHV